MPRPALLNGADATAIRIGRVAATNPEATDGPAGKWLAEDIRGGGVIDRLQTVLEIAADGTVTGTGGCNRMRGQAEIAGEKITFGPIAATRMACPAAVMDQENKFFAALAEVRTWKIDPVQQKLTLSDGAGQALVVFTRM